MPASYNLTREEWIPGLTLDGFPRELSLRSILSEAHTLREVDADSPLETMALYRLLQALVLRIFDEGMQGEKTWFELLERGQFDAKRIHAYFDEWEERFDLLHPERPFYQHPEPLTDKESSLSQLFPEEASGNNPTLFAHEMDATPRRLDLSAAARGLVATQAAAVGGGRSKPFYYSDAPLASGAVFWARGKNLFEALVLNSPPSAYARMHAWPDESQPAWEADLPVSEKRAEKGYLDYLTWQARRLRLVIQTDDDQEPYAEAVRISQGDKKEGGHLDPLMAYQESRRSGIYPLSFRKDRALWRDAHVFMQRFSEGEGGAPPVLSWIASEGVEEPMLEDRSWEIDVFGFVNDQAKIELWRHERLPFYPSILREGARYELLRQAVGRAEKQARNLRDAARTCAAALLFPGKARAELSRQEREEVRDQARSFDTVTRFWARLEIPFLDWLKKLAGDLDTKRVPAEWVRVLFLNACRAYDEAVESLDTSARHHRARVLGRAQLRPVAAYKDILQPTKEEVPA